MVSLYKHFDSNGNLLYVGISNHVIRRTYAHEAVTPWFTNVSRIEVSHFENKQLALSAERLAIKTEFPRYNINHSIERSHKLHVSSAQKEMLSDEIRKYPLVMAEMDRIPELYKKRFSVGWIADFFGTNTDIINYVLRLRKIAV